MAEKLGSLAQEFLDSVYVSGYVPGEKQKTAGGRKRATDLDCDKSKKAAKIVHVGDMKAIATSGTVSQTVFRFHCSKYISCIRNASHIYSRG